MALRLYMDVHIPRAITVGLRARGIDVLTAIEDGTDELADPDLLRHATALGRVLFSSDQDFLRITAEFQRDGIDFAGVIYAHALSGIGTCVEGLYLMAEILDENEIRNQLARLIR